MIQKIVFTKKFMTKQNVRHHPSASTSLPLPTTISLYKAEKSMFLFLFVFNVAGLIYQSFSLAL